ncbi:MAG: endo-1,4-beta-xylanase [Spirochaetes bacterium]|nr:endo-1,4-beta-xylanase [Spirochaetota bacterium]
MKKIFWLLMFVALFSSAACDSSDSDTENAKDYPTFPVDKLVKDVYLDQFFIGAAVKSTEYGPASEAFDNVYSELLPHYNSLTAENAMKPGLLQPTEGNFEWIAADRIVDYADDNGMKVRGHVLVWHSQSPDFMANLTKTAAKAKMKTHIETVMGHFGYKIYNWDVVNEAISDGEGTYRESSFWYKNYDGPEFIRDAFQIARDYAAAEGIKSKLIYNDYSVVNSDKRTRIVKMINDLNLIANGLYGVGMQAHWRLDYPSVEAIQETIDTFYDMGLEVHITELDIDCFEGVGNISNVDFDKTLSDQLANRYEELFELFSKNSEKITSVTFWGIADDYTWLDYFYNNTYNSGSPLKNYPFIFDEDHKAKEAYVRITDID